MAQRKTLTARQVDVLRWIGNGCPDDVMVEEGHPERITAGALRNRGMVTTKGSGATWSAAISEAGTEYLARVDSPNPPVPREPNRPVGQGLIEDLIAAGGTLLVPRPTGYPASGPDYERRVANAERSGKVPVGKRLVVTQTRDELRIELRDAPEGTPTEALPVPVPERVSRYHAVVAEFRDELDRHEVSRAQLPRVLRALHGLVLEAERRGYSVQGPATARVHEQGKPTWSGEAHGHLRLTVAGVVVTLRVREDGVRGQAIYPPYSYRYRDPEPPARRSFAHEEGVKGTVRISVLAPDTRTNRVASWGDGKSQTLEECLPAVLMEAETRAAEERERIRLEREEAARQQLAWEQAMARAEHRHAEHVRAEILDAQVIAWQRATAIRSYCDAIERSRSHDLPAAEWVAWARNYAASVDPLGTQLAIPDAPAEPTGEDLRPFLDGWSPYGPDRLRRW